MKKLQFIFIIYLLMQVKVFPQNGWELIHTFENQNIFSIAFKDSLTGFALTYDVGSKIYKTTDGGKNWSDINIPSLNTCLLKIKVIDNDFIIGVGGAGTIIRSFDGGNSWSTKNVGDPLSLYSICSTEDGKLFISSSSEENYKGKICKSIDKGENWSIKEIDSTSFLGDINFANNTTGFAVGNTTIKTIDGGENWFRIPDLIKGQTNKIKFINETTGFIIGSDYYISGSQIVKTTDGGISWTIIKSGLNIPGNDITTSGKNFIWVVGADKIFYSVDAGETWIEQSVSPNHYLFAADCIDSLVCFALGGEGTLYKTTNGGLPAPLLDYPKNEDTEIPLTFNFTWGSKTNASSFRIQVARDSNFNILTLDSVLTDVSFQTENLDLNTQYFWRIQDKFRSVDGPFSFKSVFTTTKGAPLLSLPQNNSIDIPLTTAFQWEDATSSADSYQFQISTDSLFNSFFYNSNTTNNNVEIKELSDSTLYFWRSRAKIRDHYGDWSNIWKFRTVGNTPRLFYPSDNSSVFPTKILFQWSKTALKNGYILQISLDSTFASPIVDEHQILSNSKEISLAPSTNYFWRVRAINSEDKIYWSIPSKFATTNSSRFPLEIGNKFFYKAGHDPDNGYYGAVKTIVDSLENGSRIIKVDKHFKDSTNAAVEYWTYDNDKFYSTYDPRRLGRPIFDGSLKDTCMSSYPFFYGCFNTLYDKFFNEIEYYQSYSCRYRSMVDLSIYNIVTVNNIGIYSYVQKMITSKTIIDSLQLIGFIRNGVVTGDTVFVNPYDISYLMLPANNSVDIPLSTTLKWSKVESASRYWLQFSTDSTFSNVIYNDSTLTDTSKTVNLPTGSTKYFWRVQTVVSDNNKYWSDSWNFTTVYIPSVFTLFQNYPNPFNLITNIEYDLPEKGHVLLKVYDILGREVTTLVNEEKIAGKYNIEFKASNLSSGIYFYRLQSGGYIETKKLVLLK